MFNTSAEYREWSANQKGRYQDDDESDEEESDETESEEEGDMQDEYRRWAAQHKPKPGQLPIAPVSRPGRGPAPKPGKSSKKGNEAVMVPVAFWYEGRVKAKGEMPGDMMMGEARMMLGLDESYHFCWEQNKMHDGQPFGMFA